MGQGVFCRLDETTMEELEGYPTMTNNDPRAADGASESKRSELDRGRPGASVAREHRRRKSVREARTREAHPWIGGLLLALRNSPRHESAFQLGELGEQAVAAYLEKRTARGPAILLHDRRMPGGYGNIDHPAIAPNGVFVIDAKNIKGKVRVANPLFGAAKLMIRGRDRTKLIDGLDRQVHAVRRALTESGHPGVPVQGVLCFVSADLPLFGTPNMRGHRLLHRRALARRLNRNGPLQSLTIDLLAHALAAALPSA
jgi:Nuclease-related domain